MKKIMAIILCAVMLAACLSVSTGAKIKESAAVGDIIYPRYVTEAPNMKEGIIDDSWGEKLIHVDTKTKNCGLSINTHDYKSAAKPEKNSYVDIWLQFDDEYHYWAFQFNDETLLGGTGGDSVCLMYEINNPNLTYICEEDPDTGDRYAYAVMGVHLSDDDYTIEDYGRNEEREVTWCERNGVVTVKWKIPFSVFGTKPSELEEGYVINFNFMRNILSDPEHWAGGDGHLYWGKWFTLLGNEPYYCVDDKNAAGPNSLIFRTYNTKQLFTDKLLTDAEYEEYMGVTLTPAEPETPAAPSVTETPSTWAAEEVNAAIAEGLVPADLQKDYTKGISRENLSKMLGVLIDKTYGKAPDKADAKFTDTTDAAVLNAANLGIINGYKQADGTYMFKPANTLKRSEMSAIINRVAKLCGKTTTGFDSEVKFTDTASHWCNAELGYPVHMGIVKGTSATTFSPENTLTTEQTIMMIYRTFKAIK